MLHQQLLRTFRGKWHRRWEVVSGCSQDYAALRSVGQSREARMARDAIFRFAVKLYALEVDWERFHPDFAFAAAIEPELPGADCELHDAAMTFAREEIGSMRGAFEWRGFDQMTEATRERKMVLLRAARRYARAYL